MPLSFPRAADSGGLRRALDVVVEVDHLTVSPDESAVHLAIAGRADDFVEIVQRCGRAGAEVEHLLAVPKVGRNSRREGPAPSGRRARNEPLTMPNGAVIYLLGLDTDEKQRRKVLGGEQRSGRTEWLVIFLPSAVLG